MDKETWGLLSNISAIISIATLVATVIIFQYRQVRKIHRYETQIQTLEQGKILKEGNIVFDEVLDNVEMAKAKLIDIMKSCSDSSKPFRIDNYGLDLETVSTLFRYTFSHNLANHDIIYRGLVIDPDSDAIAQVCQGKSNLSQSVAENAINILQEVDGSTESNFSIELYSYHHPPTMHGFVINDEHLLMGFTHFEQGGLIGGATPYLYLRRDRSSKFKESLFKTYTSWFNHWTRIGKRIIPQQAVSELPQEKVNLSRV